jgi:flavin-dependent dehydrogenase/NAD-dependent dihydropyrimidine dehydrogenase PreA subunit
MPNAVRHDPATCNACGLCVRTCPELVFTQDAPDRPVEVSFPERCIGCLACEEDCARGAIRVHRLPEGMTVDQVPAPGAGLDPDRVYDLVVIGAGPAGLAAAIRARSLGLEVAVLERLPSSRRSHHPDGGVLFGSAASYRLDRVNDGLHLDGLDLDIPAGEIRDWMHHFIVMGPDGLATRRSPAGALEFPLVAKDRLVKRLADRARELGATIAHNTRAREIAREGAVGGGDAARMRVTIDDGVAIRGRVAISAEGITGRLAEKAGVPVNEFQVGWSYAILTSVIPSARPTKEVGFLCDRLTGLPDGPPFLSYWSSGASHGEIATGPLQPGKTRAVKGRLSAYLAHAITREPRIAARMNERSGSERDAAPVLKPNGPLDGCRIYARRLPRSAVADGVIAVGDAFTTCGMLTNLTSARTGDTAAQIACEAIARGDTRASALSAFDRRVLRSQSVQGMKWMHGLLIDAPLQLPPDKLRELFAVLGPMDLGAMMGGRLGPVLGFMARSAFEGMRRPGLRRYLSGR